MDQKIAVYVGLDALFDTRLSTLYEVAADKVPEILRTSYFDRNYDEFEGVDVEVFNKAYENRGLHTLHNAMITRAAEMLMFFIDKTLKARASTPFVMQPLIHLNVYPYKLDEDVINLIIMGLRSLTKGMCDIEVIDRPLEEITPSYVKTTYAIMIMYDYWNWLERQSENKQLLSTNCADIALIGPAIVRSSSIFDEVKNEDPYQAIELYTSMFIKLQLYPISFFSVDLEKMKNMQTSQGEKKDA